MATPIKGATDRRNIGRAPSGNNGELKQRDKNLTTVSQGVRRMLRRPLAALFVLIPGFCALAP